MRSIILLSILIVSVINTQAQPPANRNEQSSSLFLNRSSINGLWGYMNSTGNQVIKHQFTEASNFSEGLATVEVNGKYGYIDLMGKLVIKPQFTDARDFSNGLASVKKDDGYTYINKEGHVITSMRFEAAYDYSEGLALVKIDGKYGYIDACGVIVISPQFDRGQDFSEGIAGVKINGRWSYINRKGRTVIQLRPEIDLDLVGSRFSEGLAAVRINNKYGYIDRVGEVIIPPQFEEASVFSEGRSVVKINNEYGYINRQGLIVIKPQYSFAANFREGLAVVESTIDDRSTDGPLKGYIDRSGKLVIGLQYSLAESFSNGFAYVRTVTTEIEEDREKLFFTDSYIDREGKVVAEWSVCEAYQCGGAKGPEQAALIPIKIESEPSGAKVYFVPIHRWKKTPNAINDQRFLNRWVLSDGPTNLKAKVSEEVFMVVFELDGRRIAERADVISSKENKVKGTFQ